MYEDIMRRPMFQTPQQRAGGGIMRGVAPVQGYQEGGEINPFGMTESSAGQPVPNDIFAEDFWTTETTEKGSGITSRDVFNFLIADPDDPTDVAIAAAMAPLWMIPPVAIAAKLARMGYKGLKVTKALEKVADVQNKIPRLIGGGTGRGSGFSQAGIARGVAGIPKAFGEEVEEGSSEGIASLPQTEEVEETEEVSSEGIASLPKDLGRFGEGDSKVRNNLANVSKEQLDAFGGTGNPAQRLTQYMNEWNKTGNRPTTLRKQQEPVEMWTGGLARLLGRLRGKGKKGGAVDDVVDETVESVAAPPKPPATIGSRILKAAGIGGGLTGLGVGGVLGASALLGDDDEESLVSEKDASPKPTIEVAQEQIQEEPGGVRGFVGKLVDKLSDPRTQYALAKAAQPSEGFVPRNFLSDVTLAGAEYDQLQSELDAKKPELVQQYEAIRPYAERGPNETEEDVDRRVFKSLFDRMDGAAALEALLTLYKSVPNAQVNLKDFSDFASNLGLGSVSRLLTKTADKQ